METGSWVKELPVAITVCDVNGVIIDMNERSCALFAGDGGRKLIGKNVLDCHPAGARAKLEEMLRKQSANTYTIAQNGKKQFIHQCPWYQNGEFRGFVEFVLDISSEVPHFDRK